MKKWWAFMIYGFVVTSLQPLYCTPVLITAPPVKMLFYPRNSSVLISWKN